LTGPATQRPSSVDYVVYDTNIASLEHALQPARGLAALVTNV